MISQLGILPFGNTGPFSAPGKISVLGVLASAENRIIVAWDVPPNSEDPRGTRSAINVSNYTIVSVDPTIETTDGPIVPAGELVPTFEVGLWRAEVDEVDATQIHLWTDRVMEGGRRYMLTIDGPIDGAVNCAEFAGDLDWTFRAPTPPPRRDRNPALVLGLEDLDDGLVPGDERSEIWRYTSAGDIDLQSSIDSLRKRIARMLSSQRGEWTYDPNFGVKVQLKAIMRQDELQRSCNVIKETLVADPLVAAVFVQARPRSVGAGAVIEYDVRVSLRSGRSVSLSIPVTVQES